MVAVFLAAASRFPFGCGVPRYFKLSSVSVMLAYGSVIPFPFFVSIQLHFSSLNGIHFNVITVDPNGMDQ